MKLLNRRNLAIVIVAVFTLVFAFEINAEDWTRFRGSTGNGVSSKAAPVEWSPKKNIKWKTELPGAGVSCPIVAGDRVFVTCYSGYGLDRKKPGKIEDLKRHVVCVNRKSGKILWDQKIENAEEEDKYSGMGVPEHGYASHTPVTDGKAVYAFLGKSGVYAFDLDGKKLWNVSVGTDSDDRRWGSASSPVLYKNLLIVPAIAESGALIAFDKKSGKEIWKQENRCVARILEHSLIVKVDGEKSDLVIGVPYEVWGLNPMNGKLRWYLPVDGQSFYTSVSSKDGIVYGSIGGRGGGGSFAVMTGGKNDVSKSHKIWESSDQSSYATPVIHDGKMFIASRGIATAIDIYNGERIQRVRLDAKKTERKEADKNDAAEPQPGRTNRRRGGGAGDYSSPVVANNKMYYVKRNGNLFVMSTDKEFKQLAVNRVTDDAEEFSTTPSISDGQIFLRSNKNLYCIEANGEEAKK